MSLVSHNISYAQYGPGKTVRAYGPCPNVGAASSKAMASRT